MTISTFGSRAAKRGPTAGLPPRDLCLQRRRDHRFPRALRRLFDRPSLRPSIDVFPIADALRPVQTQAGFTVLPTYSFTDRPAMDAFLIPGGFGTRQEMYNRRLHEFIDELPESCWLASMCTGSWVYARMGLLDGLRRPTARSRTGRSQGRWGRC